MTDLPSKNVPRNRLIMLRYIEGQSIEDIASRMGLEVVTVRNVLSSPLVRQEMEKVSGSATARITNLSDEAIDLVRDTMRGESTSELKLKAAKDILDRNQELRPKTDARDMAEGLAEGMIRALSKQIREVERGANGENIKVTEIPSVDVVRGDARD